MVIVCHCNLPNPLITTYFYQSVACFLLRQNPRNPSKVVPRPSGISTVQVTKALADNVALVCRLLYIR